jgi:hypothetical protein
VPEVTDEQIRLYAIARCVAPSGTRIRTIAEQTTGGGTLYTIEMKTPGGTLERWFAVHSSTLRAGVSDGGILAAEIRRAIDGAPPNRV